jgi:hypothetical protein
MITSEQELQQIVKKFDPQSVVEDLDFNEVIYKFWQGSNEFEGEYKGKITDFSGKILLVFLLKNKLLLYDSKDLTIAQHTNLKKIPGYDE